MKYINILHCGRLHNIDYNQSVRLSARIDLSSNLINIYGGVPASQEPLTYGSHIASVSHGGACNASQIHFIPHCHGTHTECVGHILSEVYNVADINFEPFIAATFIRVTPQRINTTTEKYNAYANNNDYVITRAAIDNSLRFFSEDYSQALIIAVDATDWLPDGTSAPYFTLEAMARIVSLGVRHLLVDIPSIDRLHDGGRMDNHRCFWGISENLDVNQERGSCSVTEMIRVPQDISEGHYFLSVHLPDITGDALPSMPMLFPFSIMDDIK